MYIWWYILLCTLKIIMHGTGKSICSVLLDIYLSNKTIRDYTMDNWLCHIYTLYYLLWNAVITYILYNLYITIFILLPQWLLWHCKKSCPRVVFAIVLKVLKIVVVSVFKGALHSKPYKYVLHEFTTSEMQLYTYIKQKGKHTIILIMYMHIRVLCVNVIYVHVCICTYYRFVLLNRFSNFSYHSGWSLRYNHNNINDYKQFCINMWNIFTSTKSEVTS